MKGRAFVNLTKKVFGSGVAVLLLLSLTSVAIAQNGTAATDPEKQKEVNEYGAELDKTIFRQYRFLERYGKGLIDDEIQAVPYKVTIIQPKRKYEKDGKEFTDARFPGDPRTLYRTDGGKVRLLDKNSVEIVQHGFIYDDDLVDPDPVGRKFKTIMLRFEGQDQNRKLKSVSMELFKKNYKERIFYYVKVQDGKPVTKKVENMENYKPDQNGHTQLDNNVTIARRSNREDSAQIAKERALAEQSTDNNRPMVAKKLAKVKNTPAEPLRNQFKNRFYREHLQHFGNLAFYIYEVHNMRTRNSDNYMLDFLKESTDY